MATRIDVSSPEKYLQSLAAVRATLDSATQSLFDEVVNDLPRLSLEYYLYKKPNDTIREVLRLLAAQDEEIIFNTRQNFFHRKSAIRLIADYWAIIRELDYQKKHGSPDLSVQFDYPAFETQLNNLPGAVRRKIVFTTTLRTIFHL